jgi:aminomuconate-semialdehyde/2-hydroxymuconate-6-semialdehyde dehydrogenase
MQLQNYIDGQYTPPISNNYIDVYNPAIGKIYAYVARSDERDVALAVSAAQKAFKSWSNTPAEKRSAILARIAQLITEKTPQLALAETTDSGKPLWLSTEVEMPRAAANFQFFATALVHTATEAHYTEGVDALNYTLRQPLGVVTCISPWNLPLYLFTWKIAPAIATGNCVIAKPSEITPYTAYLLGEICSEAGLPQGVLNIIHGYGNEVGTAAIKHPNVKAISFTGSTRAGRDIATIAAPMFKKLSLELGGKNPNIIFADCQFDNMIETTLRSSFNNQGQICLCGSRILIERSLYDDFKTAFVQRTQALAVGNPLLPQNRLGAIVSEAHYQKVLGYISLAQQEGGKVLCGGNAVKLDGEQANGWYIQPTIIEGLNQNCRTNQEEIFGPVVTIEPFDTDSEALTMANNSEYGLAATVWTQNLSRAHHFAQQLQCGIVWINCWLLRDLRTPFGGVKNSGVGREGGNEAMRFFTEAKNVCIKI